MPNKTTVQVPVTANDIVNFQVYYEFQEADGAPPVTVVTCIATYLVRDDMGAQIGLNRSLKLPLEQNEQNQLNGFINATVLKHVNAHEGT